MSQSAPNHVKSQYISSSTEDPASLCNGDISIGGHDPQEHRERQDICSTEMYCFDGRSSRYRWINEAAVLLPVPKLLTTRYQATTGIDCSLVLRGKSVLLSLLAQIATEYFYGHKSISRDLFQSALRRKQVKSCRGIHPISCVGGSMFAIPDGCVSQLYLSIFIRYTAAILVKQKAMPESSTSRSYAGG
eukprot:scaffold53559_cov55-Attheya_sp.AAC.2